MTRANSLFNVAPQSSTTNQTSLSGWTKIADGLAPQAPATLDDVGVEPEVLADLTLRLAYTAPQFATEWAAKRLCLPVPLVAELLEQLRGDKLVEILGQAGPMSYRFAITRRGRERAAHLFEVSRYVGAAPVSLDDYRQMLERQFAQTPEISPEQVTRAIADLVLPNDVKQVAGLAIASGRSLFIYGPPGNGKTTLGQLLHNAVAGEIWIPHGISIESTILKVFDPQCHERSGELLPEDAWRVDQRWIRIRRPFIVVGGELTIESLDLAYSRALGYYEAPVHFKANGGTFLIDDFGRQRVEPHQLLNRWIIPLEHQIDHLTLHTGQQIQVPFRQMLVIATNLDPERVMDPAFLRRMGYRLFLDDPTAAQYTEIFDRYAANSGASVPPTLVPRLLERYRAEGRTFRSCEPRDLIERARDICQYQGRKLELTHEVLDLAWTGYFGYRVPPQCVDGSPNPT